MLSDQIDVIIPVLNAENTISRTLSSLCDQTFQNFHVIVVDGGSTDRTQSLVTEFAEKDLDLEFVVLKGSTITEAVNHGISRSFGKFVMPWMCADDYLDKDFLANSVDALASRNRIVLFPWRAVKKGVAIKTRTPDSNWMNKIDYSMPKILSNATIFKRDVFDEIGLLNEKYKYANDYEFLLRCAKHDIKSTVNTNNAYYNFETGGLSQTKLIECLMEVNSISILHGGHIVKAKLQFFTSMIKVSFSYLLNRLRNLKV